MAVGGQVNLAPPFWGGFGIYTRLFYSPKIFSFLDAERMLEWDARLGYAITPRVRVYAGYQHIRADFEDRGKRTIDEGVRVGFLAQF